MHSSEAEACGGMQNTYIIHIYNKKREQVEISNFQALTELN